MKSLYLLSLIVKEDKHRKITRNMIFLNLICIIIKIIKGCFKSRIFCFYISPYRFHHDTSGTPRSSYFDNLHTFEKRELFFTTIDDISNQCIIKTLCSLCYIICLTRTDIENKCPKHAICII